MEKATKVLPAAFPRIGALPADLEAQLDALRDVRRRTEHLKAADRYNADNLATGPMGLLLVGRVCAPEIVCGVLRHFGERWTPAKIVQKIVALGGGLHPPASPAMSARDPAPASG